MTTGKFQLLAVPIAILAFLSVAQGTENQPKTKRQIYREQVLPSRGGKIPDGAFRTDRLALNRLNKEGIAIPDGVLLEHRLVHSHPHVNKHDPEDEAAVIKIIQKEEDRFVASPGKSHYKSPPTISSTYIIRKPIGPESTVLRTPSQQMPHHAFGQPFRNSNFHHTGYYQQQYVPQSPQHFPVIAHPPQKFLQSGIPPIQYNTIEIPSKKYLPANSPPQKYLPVGPPPQKYLPTGFTPPQKYTPTDFRFPPKKFSSPGFHPTVVHHPHPYGYDAPVSYQSVAYYPVNTPFVLPNRETHSNEYYPVKGHSDVSGNSNDIHDVIDWPALLAHYSQVSSKLDALHQDSYGGESPHSQFVTPEVLGTTDPEANYYPENAGRYTRKTKGIVFPETPKESNDEVLLIKLRCNGESENAVDDNAVQCPV